MGLFKSKKKKEVTEVEEVTNNEVVVLDTQEIEAEEEVTVIKEKITYEPEQEPVEKQQIKEEPIEKPKKELLFITDHKKDGLNEYLRGMGTNITQGFDTIAELHDVLMLQTAQTRLVMCETGTGKFVATKSREEIVDMLGACESNIRITIFYTDTIFKSDVSMRLSKLKIDWFKYETTLKMGITLRKYNEDYIEPINERFSNKEYISNIQGDLIEHDTEELIFNARLDITRIALEEEELLEGYEVIF